MKVIIVEGDDYGALQFEQKFLGTKVSEVVNNIDDYTLMEHGGVVEDDGELLGTSSLRCRRSQRAIYLSL